MKHFVALLFVALVAITPARAALVYDGWETGPGGLSTPYPSADPEVFAGLIEMTSTIGPIFAMSDDRNTLSHIGESWAMTYYSYADVQAGAAVRFTSAQYVRAAYMIDGIFNYQNTVQDFPSLRAVAEAWGNDTLASLNTQVWDIMASTSCPAFWSGCESFDTFDWSTLMAVASGGPGRDEYLVPLATQGLILGPSTIGTDPVVPLPPAIWLLGSGLLCLASIARRKK